jgi:hypothetical protein
LSSYNEPTVVVQPQVPNQDQSLILCIKSYGDYRYIAKDICYLHADNNSDIHLNTGEMITTFKTKHFEGCIIPVPFQVVTGRCKTWFGVGYYLGNTLKSKNNHSLNLILIHTQTTTLP